MDGQPDNFDTLKSFAKEIVNSLDVGWEKVRIGVVTFSNKALVMFDLKTFSDKGAVTGAIGNLPYSGGNTNTTGALRVARTQLLTSSGGARKDAPDVIILVTDGVTTWEANGLYEETGRLKNNDVKIVGIGVTSLINEVELKRIVSSPPNDYYLRAASFAQLSSLVSQVTQIICRAAQSSPPL